MAFRRVSRTLCGGIVKRGWKTTPFMGIRAASTTSLSERVGDKVEEFQAHAMKVLKEHGGKKLGEITLGAAVGGMRGLTCMVCETSLLDEQEGIRFRGHTIQDLQGKLPTVDGGSEMLPEGMLWLLMTGEIPTTEQVRAVTEDLRSRSKLSDYVKNSIDTYPKEMHPMTQLSSAVLALQPDSKFAKAYSDGMDRKELWRPCLEDSLDLIAKLPEIAARIFRNKYRSRNVIEPDSSFDWAQNYANMLGYNDPEFCELMRLYLSIHVDHEGGNVSAHATHLVGSALADPYLSYSAGMNGLAGPLHGLANQEVLKWLIKLDQTLGARSITKDQIREAVEGELESGRVIPGYGHAVLRRTDPRYEVQREFALKHLPENHLFTLVSTLYQVVPEVLGQYSKIKNPWPNVDAHSGVLLHHYGLVESEYYTVLFGVSRSIGVLSSLTMDRILRLPIERPKSITLDKAAEVMF